MANKENKKIKHFAEYQIRALGRGAVAELSNLFKLKSTWSPFYKDNPANAPKTEQIW